MFGIIADFIASITTILLPCYLSYKALRSSDPAQLTPWLIYFVILSLVLLAESWTVFIIGWFPFYSWIRLIFLSYLVLPQTQGAKLLYLGYVEPYIVQHEREIDVFIGDTHEKLEKAGLGYLNQIIEFLSTKVLGQSAPLNAVSAGAPASAAAYAQNLLSRFAMPAARTNAATSVYGMLSGVAGAAMAGTSTLGGGRSRDIPMDSGPIIPESMVHSSSAEKSNYLAAQREKLAAMIRDLDKEQQNLDLAYGGRPASTHSHSNSRGSDGGGLRMKSRSEQSFENVEYEDAPHQKQAYDGKRTSSGNWIPGVSGWFGGSGGGAPSPGEGKGKSSSKGWSAAMEVTEAVTGMSSGFDSGR